MDPTDDQVRGVLLGTMIGDALGMPVEGWSRERIRSRHGELRDMLPARLGRGTYTDDTRMALDLAEALVESGEEIDQERIAVHFGSGFDPARGYGGNTRRVLGAIRSGVPWREATDRHAPPGGSWANGASMRVAPVAVAFHSDPDRVARAAALQAEVSGHRHPVGRGGAVVQALAVRRALELGAAGRGVDAETFAGALLDRGGDEFDRALGWIADHPEASADDVISHVGTGGRASESVPAAIWAFISRSDDAEGVVVQAVNLGGDTDTIGAMAGALAGAYHGAGAFPDRWSDALENGERGRDYALELADRLGGP